MFFLLVWINEEDQGRLRQPKGVLVNGVKKNSELETRIAQLEKQLEGIQNNLQQLTKSTEKTNKEMKFFETMLLEEYHLLLQLLGKDQNIQIHQVADSSD